MDACAICQVPVGGCSRPDRCPAADTVLYSFFLRVLASWVKFVCAESVACTREDGR